MKTTETKEPNLKKNFFFNLANQILGLIAPFITAPYLSRVLHEAGNGQISYASSIITVFILFATLGFTTYGQREIAKVRNDKVERSKVFWEIVILKTLTTAITSAVFFALLYTIGFKKSNDLIAWYSIQLIGTALDITFYYYGEEDFQSLALQSIFVKTVGIVLTFCLVKTENDVWIHALCSILTTVASNVIMWVPLRKRIAFIKPTELSFKRHWIPTLEIFVPQLAITIYSVVDKLMIGWFASNSDYENGCYEQAYKINSMALLLVTVISPILLPRNAHDYQVGNMEEFHRHIDFTIHYTWMMGTPLIAGFAVLSYSLSSWFLGPGYAEVPLLMQIMSVRFILSGFAELCGTQIYIAIGKQKYFTISTIITAVINIILNYFFIRNWGATGAAITTAISELINAVILIVLACKQKYFTLKQFFLSSWKYLLSSGIMFATIYFMQKYMVIAAWSFFVIMFTGGIEYFLLLMLFHDSFFLTWFKRIWNKLFRHRKNKEIECSEGK